MSIDNPLWEAPRIHGELLKLCFEVAQSTAAKYMVTRWGPPSQRWRTFLRNRAPDIAAVDLFVVPTIGFSLLYAFVIVRLDRRELVWINATRNPTAEWIARQLTEAFPCDEAPATSFGNTIASMAKSPCAEFAQWAFGTSLTNAPVAGPGHAGGSSGSAIWNHCRHAGFFRVAS